MNDALYTVRNFVAQRGCKPKALRTKGKGRDCCVSQCEKRTVTGKIKAYPLKVSIFLLRGLYFESQSALIGKAKILFLGNI